MDSQIYALFSKADQEKNFEYVRQAYGILDPEVLGSSREKTAKDIENFSQSLYIECAEKAIGFKEYEIANRCLKLYFSVPAIANQFLARAYLCQFELLAPKSTEQHEHLQKAVPFLYKAIEFSKQNKRYNFLIYNSSAIYWKYARAFLKPNFKRFLRASLKKITDALRDIDDADYEWRAFLERILIEAYIDSKKIEEANSLANSLLKFIQNYLPPQFFEEFFEFLAINDLLTDEDLKSISASKWQLTAIYRIEKLKRIKESKKDAQTMNEEQIQNELDEIYKLLRPKNKFSRGDVEEESDENKSSQFMKSFENKKDELISNQKRQKLLIKLARVCLLFDQVNLCSQIIGFLKESDLVDDESSLEIELIECEQAVKELRHKQEKYTKAVIKRRLECILKCQEALQNALRLNSPRLVQLGCMVQWNLCLPLLQPGLRVQVRKPLQHVAESLEQIESMEWLLRSRIHFELAKCDEEIEQLQTAEQHLLKAIRFDDEKVHAEQLDHSLKRLRLRAELYKTPERTEDQAAMILEQCVVNSGSTRGAEKRLKPAVSELIESLDGEKQTQRYGHINTHSLLLRAADLLAPNDFTHVLESETYKANVGKLSDDQVSLLHKKALNYENCTSKGVDHLNHRLSDIELAFTRNRSQTDSSSTNPNEKTELESILKADFKERLKLWFDLSKIARKQQIWDLCRVSCRFCTLYDTPKYIDRFLKKTGSNSASFASLFDQDLMRNLAEAHFIFGESLVQYIRGEGVELLEKPQPPNPEESTHAHHHSSAHQQNNRDFNTDSEWLAYCEWLNGLSKQAVDHFLRGIQIGVQLSESWLVSQGSAYLWNYFHHKLEKRSFNQLVSTLTECLDALRKVGHNNEPELLVSVCVALGNGLMQNWLPPEQAKSLQIPNFLGESSDKEKHARKGNAPAANPASNQPAKIQFSLSAEAQSDIRKALEICDYAMNVTNGENLSNLVNLKDRYPLIKTWVLAKQLGQQPVRNLGIGKVSPGIERAQDKYTKCMVGVEILNRNMKMQGLGSSSFEIKDAPSIRELIGLVDLAQPWPDRLIELELWSNLCVLASKATNQTENVRYCHGKALETLSYFEKKKNDNMNIYITSQHLLSEACLALGENLAAIISSSNQGQSKQQQNSRESIFQSSLGFTEPNHQSQQQQSTAANREALQLTLRRNALNAFADAASYAARAQNYHFVVHAARHFWNLSISYLQQPRERATLYENLMEILTSWQVVFKFKPADPVETELSTHEKSKTETSETTKAKPKKSDNSEVKSKDSGGGKKSKDTKSSSPPPKSPRSKSPRSKSPPKSKQTKQTIVSNDQTIATTTTTNTVAATTAPPVDPQIEDAFDDLTLRCALYACFFQILIDRNEQDEALAQMERALNDMPRSTRHRLLIYRFKVITKSRMGLDVQMDLQKFREESEKNLAQMYRKVAISSLKHSDTISSYQRAIEALSSEESIWLKFEYILELSEWLYSNEYELDRCLDLAEWAVDLVMLNNAAVTTTKAANVAGQAESIKNSSRSRISTASASASAQQQRRVSRAVVTAPSKQTRHANKMPTILDESQHSITSIGDMATTTISSSQAAAERNAEEEIEILMRKSKRDNLFESASTLPKPNSWDELDDIKQLECLIRAHVALAQMCGRSSNDHADYVLKAYYSIVRLIQVAIENASDAWKEIQKLNLQSGAEAADTKDGKKNKEKDKGETGKKSNLGDNPKGSIKKLGKLAEMPQTPEQWSQFELNDEIQTCWRHDLMKKSGINNHTVSEPYLLFHSLDKLDRLVDDLGYDQLRFAVCHLQLILINTCLKFDQSSTPHLASLNAYVRFKMINLCTELNLIGAVEKHHQALANTLLNDLKNQPQQTTDTNAFSTLGSNPLTLLKLLQIDANEVCIVRDRIAAYKARLANAQNEEAAAAAAAATAVSSNLGIMKSTSFLKSNNKQQKQTKINEEEGENVFKLNAGKGANRGGLVLINEVKLPGEMRKFDNSLSEALYKDVWINMAELLIDCGLFQVARDYLFECLNASQAFDDKITLAKVHYLLSRVALFDYNYIEARQYASHAQKTPVDEMFWLKSVLAVAESHKIDFSDKESYDKAIGVLKRAVEMVSRERRATSRRKNKSDKLAYIEAMLSYEMAELIRDGVLNGRLSDHETLLRRKMNSKRSVRLNSMHPIFFKRLSEVCNTYQSSIELLLTHGYKRESIKVIRSHASLLKTFANDCHNQEARHEYLLQAYTVLNDGCSLVGDIYSDVGSLQNWTDTQSISLPIQRQFIDLKLEFCHLLTDILEVELEQVIFKNESNLTKDTATKAIENYIEASEPTSELEVEWKTLISKLPDMLLSSLTSLHALSSKLKSFKARCYFLVGRTYRLSSELVLQLGQIIPSDDRDEVNDDESAERRNARIEFQLPLSRWNNLIVEIYRTLIVQLTAQQAAEQEAASAQARGGNKLKSIRSASNLNITTASSVAIENNPETAVLDASANVEKQQQPQTDLLGGDFNVYRINHLKNLITTTNQYESQALECLMQAQNLAFLLDDTSLSQVIALEMIEIVGRYDMSFCSQLIAFYQSCSNAIEAEKIVEKSSSDPKNSLLTGCLNQIKFYKSQHVRKNSLNSPMIKQLLDMTKSKLNAFKYLSVGANHFNLSKDLPLNYTFLILQHNLQKTELYCSILDRAKPQTGVKTSKSSASSPLVKTLVNKIKTDPFELHHLKQLWSDWRGDLQAFHLKLEFQLSNSQSADGSKDLHQSSSITESYTSDAQSERFNETFKNFIKPNNPKYGEMLEIWLDLEDKFEYLLQRTETYLRRISELIQSYFSSKEQQPNQGRLSMSGKAMMMSQPFLKPNERLIILADLDLMEFPLELLQVFHNSKSVAAISRDFSLHFFATRFNAQKELDSPNKPEEGKKNDKASKANVKQQQQQQQNQPEPLPESSVVIDHSKLKYMIDVYNESTIGLPDDVALIGSFKRNIMQKYNQVSSKWTGLLGTDHISSIGERESLLADSNCLIFSGTDRFLSYFNSRHVASSNLNDCRFLLANDLAQTNKSYIRVGKQDALRIPQSELECEHPVETSLLLTLAGVKAIALNQWSSTVVENSTRLQNIMRDQIESRQASSETIRYMRAPHLKRYIDEQLKRDEEMRRLMTEKKEAAAAAKKDKKDSKAKSPTRDKSPSQAKKQLQQHPQQETILEDAELGQKVNDVITDIQISIPIQSDEKPSSALDRIEIDNSTMIYFGLPDIYLTN